MSTTAPRDGALSSESERPVFLITIDTEGDDIWSAPREITTNNSRFLPRFQQLCEKYNQRPTWLTNWEMVECPVFREFAHDVLQRGAGEIGMHLHAWNNPPNVPLTKDDFGALPYLTQFSEWTMRQKIRAVTDRLEETFGVKMLSHRAGRWAFNSTYARLLIEHGYVVDCSVAPGTHWTHETIPGEIDFRGFPVTEYFVNPDDISQQSVFSPLLEVPMTVLPIEKNTAADVASRMLSVHSFGRRVSGRLFPEHRWLRPNGRNSGELIDTMAAAIDEGRSYVEFMLHSSEFMPGGSPRFSTADSVERLYDDLENLFEAASKYCCGLTLAEFHGRVTNRVRQTADSKRVA